MAKCTFFAKGSCNRRAACRFEHDGTPSLRVPASTSPATLTTGIAQPRKEVCIFYLQGRCQWKADECSYEHPAGRDPRATVPCKFFLRGFCKTDTCPYQHEANYDIAKVTSKLSSLDISAQTKDSRATIQCKFFESGACNKDSCLYRHEAKADAEMVEDVDQDQDPFIREYGEARVHFDPGAAVSKVVLSSDFSAIRLHGLTQGSSPKEVSNILMALGFDVPTECLKMGTDHSSGDCADITMDDSFFAHKLSRSVAGLESTSLRVSISAVPLFSGSGHERLHSCRIICSWHKPTRTALCRYHNMPEASRARRKFLEGKYNVDGLEVDIGIMERCGPPGTGQGYAFTLEKLLPSMSMRVIEEAFEDQRDRPERIELSAFSYPLSEAVAIEEVKQMLCGFGLIESTQANEDQQSRRQKLSVWFQNEADGLRAAQELHGTRLSFSRGRLTVKAIHSAKFKIGTHVYRAIRDNILGLIPEWQEQGVSHVVFRGDAADRYTKLRLDGEDSQLVAKARNEVKKAIEGRVAMRRGIVLWSHSLNDNGPSVQKLKDIALYANVVIVKDKPKCQIRLIGSEDKCHMAKMAIAGLLNGEEAPTNAIRLDAQQFKWACHGGFNYITEVLGEGVVTLDVVSNPKRFIITGSEDDLKTLQTLIDAGAKAGKDIANIEGQCSICWSPAENPIKTMCAHVYCLDCFENMCTSTGPKSKDVSVACAGEYGNCKTVFDLSELKDHLSSSAFEDVLKLSFETFVRRRPTELRNCPTPDCAHIYRATSHAATATCPSCGLLTCTKCHASHGGVTCAEYKEITSGGYEALARFKEEHGIKDCPQCNSSLDKIEGCNHVECQGCGIHICWRCLATFEQRPQCYEHMLLVHSAYVDNPEDAFNWDEEDDDGDD